MDASKRQCATLIAAVTLSLGFFGICADASHAAPQGARPIASYTHSRKHAARALHVDQSKRAKCGKKRSAANEPREMRLMATAYIPSCDGCSGITKTGMPAGHGVVAVDPRVIPLGTKLYVPGYGHALAGDTGGDIQGRRIDLGFDSLGAAQRFGRREIVVYVLPPQKASR